MKAEITQMLKQGGGGAVVNTSSGAGLAGIRGMPAYAKVRRKSLPEASLASCSITLVDLANRSGGSVQDNLNAGKLDSS